MHHSKLSYTSLLTFALVLPGQAAFTLNKTYDSSNFGDSFEFRVAADYPGTGDPTHGFVNYVSLDTAKSQGLFRTENNQVYIGADDTNVISTEAQGRNSLRLEAKETFDGGLLIADIAHMPGSQCGVWPAFWSYNFQENPISEIDIIEGVSLQKQNIASLHTCDACSFTDGTSARARGLNRHNIHRDTHSLKRASPLMTGQNFRSDCTLGGNCGGDSTNYVGCGVTSPEVSSYGTGFNDADGGVYAMLLDRTPGSSSIQIWHFTRSQVPSDVTSGSPNPNNWPLPMVSYSEKHGSCDISNIFHGQTIIINIDFCGSNVTPNSWANDATCGQYPSCESFVAGNPKAFSESYWLFNSIKTYVHN